MTVTLDLPEATAEYLMRLPEAERSRVVAEQLAPKLFLSGVEPTSALDKAREERMQALAEMVRLADRIGNRLAAQGEIVPLTRAEIYEERR